MPAVLQGESLQKWLDPRTEHPEQILQPTPSEEFDAKILPATRYGEFLSPEELAEKRRRSKRRQSSSEKELPLDLFGTSASD